MKKLFTLLFALAAVAAAAQRPLIGISCSWIDGVNQTSSTYTNSIILAGGVPVIFPLTSDEEALVQMVASVDAVVMIGGEDFSPLLYGEEPAHALGGVVPERDRYDIFLMKRTVALGKPLLGICRGMQGINIAFGGTLYQDIPSQYGKPHLQHRQQLAGKWGSHTVTLEEGSAIATILGVKSVAVNSFHHQAAKDIAPGFRVTARAADGMVEAIEEPARRILAVQFHPEGMTNGGDTEMLKIFRWFVSQAAAK